MGLYMPKYLVIGDTINDDPVIHNNLTINNHGMIFLRALENIVVLPPNFNYLTSIVHDDSHVTTKLFDEDLNMTLSNYKLLSLKKIYDKTGITHISVLIRLPTLNIMRYTDIYRSTLLKYMCLINAPIYLHMSICNDVINNIFGIIVILCIYDHYSKCFHDNQYQIAPYFHDQHDIAEMFQNKLKKWFVNVVYEL